MDHRQSLASFGGNEPENLVAICFICNHWALYLDGKTVSYTSLKEERGEVLAAVKAMFPKDEIIQGIPEKL